MINYADPKYRLEERVTRLLQRNSELTREEAVSAVLWTIEHREQGQRSEPND